MKTSQTDTTTTMTDLTSFDDATIETYFARAGLAVAVVDHCNHATCPLCFVTRSTTRAA